MFTAEKYVAVANLDEAYELNKNKNNVIMGGLLWLKMSNRKLNTMIDLSKLGLDSIEECKDYFKIGCMCTLRQIEKWEPLKDFFGDCIEDSLKHIVGVQFRNCATIGGSIYSRFGFSDILTLLLALNADVELYKKGRVSLSEYVDMPYDNDILVHIIIKKRIVKSIYCSQRLSETDFPILACAVSKFDKKWRVVLGGRPHRALLLENSLSSEPAEIEIEQFIEYVKEKVPFGSNIRGSEEYRRLLAEVLINRSIKSILGGCNGN